MCVNQSSGLIMIADPLRGFNHGHKLLERSDEALLHNCKGRPFLIHMSRNNIVESNLHNYVSVDGQMELTGKRM